MRNRGIKLGATMGAMMLLAACATVPNPISQSEVYGVENGYGVVQSAALAYIALPRCGAGQTTSLASVCSEHRVIVQLANADQKARIALNALEAFARNPKNYPGLSFSALLATAQSAISTLQQIESTNQIGA